MVKRVERRPRVLHVIARMNVGGTAVYLSNLVLGLEKLGIENLLVIGSVPPGEVEDSVVEKLPIRRVSSMSRAISYSADRLAQKEIEKIHKSLLLSIDDIFSKAKQDPYELSHDILGSIYA